ncbi:MAG TPA: hypothetical protein VHT26_20720 [Trebonia sp.]|jgi:hypothetical protein|nr:hypothetical protein [Trebonia sp.]
MATVRIAHVEPWPGKLPDGRFETRGFLLVLADDVGRPAVPIWLIDPPAGDLTPHRWLVSARPLAPTANRVLNPC